MRSSSVGHRTGFLLSLVLFCLVTSTWPAAHAASLEVGSAAARVGSSGLRVTVGSSCTAQESLELNNQTVSGPAVFEACGDISATGTTITGTSEVHFRAGQSVTLGDGFNVQSGVDLFVETDPTFLPDAVLVDRSPGSETHYSAGFYVRPDGVDFGASEALTLLEGLADNGAIWFRLALKWYGALSEYRLILYARVDSGGEVTTSGSSEVVLGTGWSWVAIDWKAARSGQGDGHFRLYVDTFYKSSLDGLDNDGGKIDSARIGARNVDAGTTGYLDLDHFISRRAGPVGPPL